jgi:hypothetical protein
MAAKAFSLEPAVQIELMLDPKALIDVGQAFVLSMLRSMPLPITAKQSAHALMNLRVLRACGFAQVQRMIHLALPLQD